MIVSKNAIIEDQNRIIVELKDSLNVLDNFNSRWDEEEKLVDSMKQKLMNRDQEMKLIQLQALEHQIRQKMLNQQFNSNKSQSVISTTNKFEKYSPKMRFA